MKCDLKVYYFKERENCTFSTASGLILVTFHECETQQKSSSHSCTEEEYSETNYHLESVFKNQSACEDQFSHVAPGKDAERQEDAAMMDGTRGAFWQLAEVPIRSAAQYLPKGGKKREVVSSLHIVHYQSSIYHGHTLLSTWKVRLRSSKLEFRPDPKGHFSNSDLTKGRWLNDCIVRAQGHRNPSEQEVKGFASSHEFVAIHS